MSKERLKEIQEKYDMWDEDFSLDPQDVEWLIGQTERTQDLEEFIETVGSTFHTLEKLFMESEQQNKRYRAALEFYADRNNYLPEHLDPETDEKWSKIDYDEGLNARKTLEKECTNDRYSQTNFR